MNGKLTIVLVVMAIIPIGLLVWMGFAEIRLEQDRQKQQIQYLGRQELEIVKKNLTIVFKELEDELDQALDEMGSEIDVIRDFQRNHNLIKQVFIADKDGLKYPNPDIPLSSTEQSFLSRISETDISFNFLQKPDTENQKTTTDKGWHTWFMGNGLHFIYWTKRVAVDNEFVIQGIELNRSALLSIIINSLPETDENNSSFRISLFNVSGIILYQWGSWPPPENITADSSMSLNYPLSPWHLEYYNNPEAEPAGGNSLLLTVLLLVIFLVIITLSIYLYRESTREIREASQKVSFVNQVSHELKTPLTNIRMYAESLDEKIAEEDKRNRKYLNIIISETGRLGRLINNILNFAKDQKKGIAFNPVKLIPDEVISRLLNSFDYSLESRKIKLSKKLNASNTVMMDPDILEQILSNLISNVEKYAADGKWVEIESSQINEIFILTVTDRGPGIPDNLKDKIFEPFFRVSNKLTDGVSGTGIGLALVRILAEVHGGSAVLLSGNIPADDNGAIFQVRLKTTPEGS